MEKISAIDIGLDKETVASICNSEKSASKIIVKRRAAYTKLSQKEKEKGDSLRDK